jgi:hypothetical protein
MPRRKARILYSTSDNIDNVIVRIGHAFLLDNTSQCRSIYKYSLALAYYRLDRNSRLATAKCDIVAQLRKIHHFAVVGLFVAVHLDTDSRLTAASCDLVT